MIHPISKSLGLLAIESLFSVLVQKT